MHNEIRKKLEKTNAHPFLFVGSGFTHRYLNSDDWKSLVERFAKLAIPGNEFAYQVFEAQLDQHQIGSYGVLPAITQLVEVEFKKQFFVRSDFAEARTQHAEALRLGVSPLKLCVSDWLQDQAATYRNRRYPEEISALGHASRNIAGIITTNFDCYLEHLFPKYERYIGQNSLLFNPSFGVGEIYKIHGCTTEPASMVLTQSDYATYQDQNAYLSAKLLTIFLEHPILFIGYSLNDANIRSIFQDIANCLSAEQLATLSERLFFVQRSKPGREPGFSKMRESFQSKFIEFQVLTLEDFSTLYKSIAALRTSYPPRILRSLKRDIYALVNSSEPKDRIQVVGIDDATDMDKVEFVIGVGAIQKLAGVGYSGLDMNNLAEDLLIEERGYDANTLVHSILPKLGKQCSNRIPIFKYISRADQTDIPSSMSELKGQIQIKGKNFWTTDSMLKVHKNRNHYANLLDVIRTCNLDEEKNVYLALDELSFLDDESIDMNALKQWLAAIYCKYNPIKEPKQPLSSNFRRALLIYDWLAYGNKKSTLGTEGSSSN